MTSIQQSVFTRVAASAGKKVFGIPAGIETKMEQIAVQRAQKGLKGTGLGNKLRSFAKNWLTDYDYKEFTSVGIGKFKFLAARPPIGAMLLLLYPGTVGPREIRAYQRGKEKNDLREMGDVLRRDLLGISLFVFLLDPLTRAMNKLKQKWDGLELVDKASNKLLGYSQFANYKLDSEHALIRILEEGNGQGLVGAAKRLTDRGLSNAGGSSELAACVKGIQEKMPKFVKAQGKEREQLAKQIIQYVQNAERLADEAVKAAQKGGSKKLLKAAQKLQGTFDGMVSNYAKTRRLPADVLSFAVVVGAIGFFPVWFNKFWNKFRFDKKQQAKHDDSAAPAGFASKPAFQALTQPTPFAASGLPTANPFQAQVPMTYPVGIQQSARTRNDFRLVP